MCLPITFENNVLCHRLSNDCSHRLTRNVPSIVKHLHLFFHKKLMLINNSFELFLPFLVRCVAWIRMKRVVVDWNSWRSTRTISICLFGSKLLDYYFRLKILCNLFVKLFAATRLFSGRGLICISSVTACYPFNYF